MLEKLRLKLAHADALPLLVVLGIFTGLFAGGIIICFRLIIESVQAGFLPQGNPENYEALSTLMRFVLPFAGAVLIGALFYGFFKGPIPVGIVHVLERLDYHQGHLPLKHFIAQFVTAAISIISGHSVGREGPGVHLGAAGGSFIGQWLQLPNNTLRILVACGAAASIAASFNTPIAGVIFAMEVIVMEYTLAGFAPIIISAVSATILTQAVFSGAPVFSSVSALKLSTLSELSALLVTGVLVGALAALFNWALRVSTLWAKPMHYMLRMTVAGAVTGVIAMAVPEVMSIGYDTVNMAISGELAIGVLVIIVLAKILATAIGLGLGLPGGLIGPTLVIGAAAGGLIGIVMQSLTGSDPTSIGFFAMLGMAAMMGATLQAPLAALMALLELTVNTHVILPGMLVVIIAGLTSSHLFKQQGIFIMLMKERGLDFSNSPIAQSLRRVGVSSIMSRSLIQQDHLVKREQAAAIAKGQAEWIVIEKNRKPVAIMYIAELANFLRIDEEAKETEATEKKEEIEEIDLLEIPAHRYDSGLIQVRDTLQAALEKMDDRHLEVLVVGRRPVSESGKFRVEGIVTRNMVETHYRHR